MSKNLYIHLFDKSKDWKDPSCCLFVKVSSSQDLAGFVTQLAHRNGSTQEDIRLFVLPSKRIWDEHRINWSRGCDWKRLSV